MVLVLVLGIVQSTLHCRRSRTYHLGMSFSRNFRISEKRYSSRSFCQHSEKRKLRIRRSDKVSNRDQVVLVLDNKGLRHTQTGVAQVVEARM